MAVLTRPRGGGVGERLASEDDALKGEGADARIGHADRAKIVIEIFELCAHVSRERLFEAGAHRPAEAILEYAAPGRGARKQGGRQILPDRDDFVGAAVSEASRHVSHKMRRELIAEARPHGSEIFEIAVELRARDRRHAGSRRVRDHILEAPTAAHGGARDVRLDAADEAVGEFSIVARRDSTQEAV